MRKCNLFLKATNNHDLMEFIYWLNNDLFLNSIFDFVQETLNRQSFVTEDEYYDLHIAENITCNFAYFPLNTDTYCICPDLCFVDDIKKISAESRHLLNEDFMVFRFDDGWFELTVWHGFVKTGKINVTESNGKCKISSKNLSAFNNFFTFSNEDIKQITSDLLEEALKKLKDFSGYDLDVNYQCIKNNKSSLSAEFYSR